MLYWLSSSSLLLWFLLKTVRGVFWIELLLLFLYLWHLKSFYNNNLLLLIIFTCIWSVISERTLLKSSSFLWNKRVILTFSSLKARCPLSIVSQWGELLLRRFHGLKRCRVSQWAFRVHHHIWELVINMIDLYKIEWI